MRSGIRVSLGLFVVLGVLYFVFGSFGKPSEIVIGVPNWESGAGTAYILQEMLEDVFSVSVRLAEGTNEMIYAGIGSGAIHIHPEGWVPNHDGWHREYGDVLVQAPHTVSATQGICVSRPLAEGYSITGISDLVDPEKVSYFDSDGDGLGELWIGVSGWGSTSVERIRAKSYGYDKTFELLEIEELSALSRLDVSVRDGYLFAFFCYTPHWMWQAYDIVQLEEPPHDPAKWRVVFPSESDQWLEESDAAVAWNTAALHIYYAKELERYPAIISFLHNVRFTADELSEMTYMLAREGVAPAEYADRWMRDNRERVLMWAGR